MLIPTLYVLDWYDKIGSLARLVQGVGSGVFVGAGNGVRVSGFAS